MKAVASLLLVLVAGCGYHLSGTGSHVPEGARTISIGAFTNRTRTDGLEVRLRRAIEDEFRRRGPLRVVPEPQGDLVLRGDIRSLTNVPVASSSNDDAVLYQAVIQLDVRLVERAAGTVLREARGLQETQDFGAVSGAVITSSPRFQRGTIDARDLSNMTNVELGESRRRDAVRQLLDLVARDVYEHAMEDF